MNIALNFPSPLKKGAVQKYAKTIGLSKQPPLELAEAAVPLGDKPVVEFSQQVTHMDLSPWFPEGKRDKTTTITLQENKYGKNTAFCRRSH